MPDFNFISKKWQKKWEDAKIFSVVEDTKKEKYYVLEMYPYPSASFLHMGHVRNYTIGDVYARFKRMNGLNVLYPMGYDSFGLPAETAAKKEGIHPKEYTERSIKKIMEYQKALGNSYDWDRVLSSHDPDYYRWNQFFFVKLFEKGLVYRKKTLVNWCPNCESVLANEEAEGGKCWRCDSEVIKKDLEQWFFKITAYADRLLEDLDKIEWPERIKLMQKNWIGKSHGTEIYFEINKLNWPVFTTRPDTIFGVTFMVISALHPRLMELVTKDHKKEVEEFVKGCQKVRTQEEIEALDKDGVFTGSFAINPANGEKIPVWAGNFVLADYGSGMVMAVPAHDQRDFEFAKKYDIPIRVVIDPGTFDLDSKKMSRAFVEVGNLVNSADFNGSRSTDAIDEITSFLAKKKQGKKVVNYKIRDWMISRQRYWGTPIPIIHCSKCGLVAVPEKDLPVLLPEEVDFNLPNPLAANKDFVNTICPSCHGPAKRETDTMGGFMDSSWYFLRFCDNKNKKEPFAADKVNYWMPVNQYIGGAEHAVMHLLYARFFVKALKDMKIIAFDEPFAKLFNQGIVYKDGAKMSKSKGNVVYQTDISNKYGIDTARLFLMSVAAPDKVIEWRDEGIEGSFRFLNRLYFMVTEKKIVAEKFKNQESKRNKCIKEVTEYTDNFNYNLALISLMQFTNYLNSQETIDKDAVETLLIMLSPFVPHTCEELWEHIGNKPFVSLAKWPSYDESKIDLAIESQEALVYDTIKDVHHVLELAKIEKPKTVTIFVSEDWKFAFFRKLRKELETTHNVSDLIKATMDKEHGKEISQLVPRLAKDPSRVPLHILSQKDEILSLKAAEKKFKEHFECPIVVIPAENSQEPKAKQSMPGKPAILVN